MNETRTIVAAPIRKRFRVRASQQKAFDVFLGGMGRWWPKDHSLLGAPQRDVVVDPRAGGRWYEIGEDGSQCQWGDVLAWEPPHRLVLAWRINMEWTFDPKLLTEIEITFTDVGNGETEVRLEHSKFENFGAGAENALQVFDGWHTVLARYADAL